MNGKIVAFFSQILLMTIAIMMLFMIKAKSDKIALIFMSIFALEIIVFIGVIIYNTVKKSKG